MRYLGNALDGGHWHSLEGLSIFAWAQGIPRRAFNQALSTFQLARERRGFLEEWFVRLVPESDESALLRALDELVAAGELRIVDFQQNGHGPGAA